MPTHDGFSPTEGSLKFLENSLVLTPLELTENGSVQVGAAVGSQWLHSVVLTRKQKKHLMYPIDWAADSVLVDMNLKHCAWASRSYDWRLVAANEEKFFLA